MHKAPILDEEEQPAIQYLSVEDRGGIPYVKSPVWVRWRRLDTYLTGTVCFPRNGDYYDLRRDNLIPAAQPWKRP